MKVHTTMGVFEIDVPKGMEVAQFVVTVMSAKLSVQGVLTLGYLHEIEDLESRKVGRRIDNDEEIDPEGEYFFVTEQPTDG